MFAGKSTQEIAGLEVWEGNRKRTLGELFEIDGEAGTALEEVSIRVLGDAGRVRRIGEAMSAGRIVVEGDAGMHLGEGMKGGTITVAGDAGSWAGSKMRMGTIEVKGDAGDYSVSYTHLTLPTKRIV